MTLAKNTKSPVIPGMRYRDCPAAIEWLCKALGFEKHAVHMEGDLVMHAQLSFGNGMIMLGSAQKKQNEYSRWTTMPDEVGGRETRSVYLVVDDCDAAYAQAKAAGAEMIFDLEEKPYGGKGFTCRDPEGYLWHIGSYDPWADQS